MSEFEGLADTLSCSECGERIDAGYVPADGEALRRDEAVCETCGWGAVGHMGCAPTLTDFDDPDALVRVEGGPGDYGVGDVKE